MERYIYEVIDLENYIHSQILFSDKWCEGRKRLELNTQIHDGEISNSMRIIQTFESTPGKTRISPIKTLIEGVVKFNLIE